VTAEQVAAVTAEKDNLETHLSDLQGQLHTLRQQMQTHMEAAKAAEQRSQQADAMLLREVGGCPRSRACTGTTTHPSGVGAR
jgi:hypothetical protein